jgi:hypothetical protein
MPNGVSCPSNDDWGGDALTGHFLFWEYCLFDGGYGFFIDIIV